MRYRKKPVVIDAVQFEGGSDSAHRVDIFTRRGCSSIGIPPHAIEIKTLEGTMVADMGDWIIRGVKGEYYPCKPDIFEATYEKEE